MNQYILYVDGSHRKMSSSRKELEALEVEITNHWEYAQKAGGRRDTGRPKPVFYIKIRSNK